MAKASLSYYRGRWPEEVIPKGCPEWLYYEVDRQADIVLRYVEVFPGGSSKRNSIALEEQWGAPCFSLVGDSFVQTIEQGVLQLISQDTFEALWEQGVNTPFWEVAKPK
ncbi:hypothetical protein [Nitrospirillum amazonense]|uniref:hypothetical protein n=1 Tax=Nitrospirillum amazonense TaxID=28077 RepID=UPI0011A6EE2B|nr:hypothetical protein [Nitrospirillum amazonense]